MGHDAFNILTKFKGKKMESGKFEKISKIYQFFKNDNNLYILTEHLQQSKTKVKENVQFFYIAVDHFKFPKGSKGIKTWKQGEMDVSIFQMTFIHMQSEKPLY